MPAALLVILLALAPGVAVAGDSWSWRDTSLEASFAAVVIVDVAQTRQALAHGGEERNPLLGSRPSGSRLRAAAGLAILGHAAVSALLPTRARRWWQAVSLGLEIGAAVHNFTVGAQLEF